MGKFCPDNTMDVFLDYIAGSDYLVVCSGSPVIFEDAFTTNALAKVVMASGSYTKADDISGRKLTVSAKTGIPITASGDAMTVALLEKSGSTLRYTTSCMTQTLTISGSVDTNSWKINLLDAT